MQRLKRLIESRINALGWDLHRLNPNSNSYFQLFKALQRFEIDLVFDVGANMGQFATRLRSVGFTGKIVSFEPLSQAHQVLSETARRDTNWEVHPRSAIGDHNGRVDLNISGNSVSSSLLQMTDSHSAAAENSSYIGKESAPLATMDSVAGQYLAPGGRAFLKIDTQGYEWQVMDGAQETLRTICGIQCEISLVPLYVGQRLWDDLLPRLRSEGFTLWAIQNGFTDPKDGRTLQVDATVFRL